jgi:hypothetical protein
MLLLFPGFLLSQNSTQRKIHTAAIRYYYGYKPVAIVLIDSTVNYEITRYQFSNLISEYKGKTYLQFKEVDSSWKKALNKADGLKLHLKNKRIQLNNADSLYVQMASKDSIMKSNKHYAKEGGFRKVFKVSDLIELSDIILLGNKAIVALDLDCGLLCGESVLIFLEKKKKKWIGIYRVMISVS